MKYLSILTLLFCVPLFAADVEIDLKDNPRQKYIERAHVWKSTDISKMDILAGPKSDVSVPMNAQVQCEYVEPKEKMTGRWLKFLCKTKSGKIVRIKYGAENKEINAEAAASRFLWALGFYAD